MKWAYALIFVATSAFGHSHYPSTYGGPDAPMDAVTLTPVKVVPVHVGNLNDYPQAYEITVDGKVVGTTDPLVGGTQQVFNVPVKLDAPDTPEIHQVCSVSVAKEGQTFRTRICTNAKLYWKK